MANLVWLDVDNGNHDTFSTAIAMVPGGWLLKETVWRDKEHEFRISCSLIFIPDPEHSHELEWQALTEEGFYEYRDAQEKQQRIIDEMKK